MMKKLVLFILFGIVLTSSPFGVYLFWDENAPTDQVIGYRLYYGTNSGQYLTSIEVGLSNRCFLVITNTSTKITASLPNPGKTNIFIWNKANFPTDLYFAATAYNSFGESEYSNQIMLTNNIANTTNVIEIEIMKPLNFKAIKQ
ncbi:MAG: hypothetical protein AABY22_13555 [Nanoarchaeota archaeon]